MLSNDGNLMVVDETPHQQLSFGSGFSVPQFRRCPLSSLSSLSTVRISTTSATLFVKAESPRAEPALTHIARSTVGYCRLLHDASIRVQIGTQTITKEARVAVLTRVIHEAVDVPRAATEGRCLSPDGEIYLLYTLYAYMTAQGPPRGGSAV